MLWNFPDETVTQASPEPLRPLILPACLEAPVLRRAGSAGLGMEAGCPAWPSVSPARPGPSPGSLSPELPTLSYSPQSPCGPQRVIGRAFQTPWVLAHKQNKVHIHMNGCGKIPEKSQRFCSHLPLQRCQSQPTRLDSSRNLILGMSYSPPRLSPSVPTTQTDEWRLLGEQSQQWDRVTASHLYTTGNLGWGHFCHKFVFKQGFTL